MTPERSKAQLETPLASGRWRQLAPGPRRSCLAVPAQEPSPAPRPVQRDGLGAKGRGGVQVRLGSSNLAALVALSATTNSLGAASPRALRAAPPPETSFSRCRCSPGAGTGSPFRRVCAFKSSLSESDTGKRSLGACWADGVAGPGKACWRDTGTFVMGDPAPRLLSPLRRGEARANVIKQERQEERPLSPRGRHMLTPFYCQGWWRLWLHFIFH